MSAFGSFAICFGTKKQKKKILMLAEGRVGLRMYTKLSFIGQKCCDKPFVKCVESTKIIQA